MYIPEVSDLRFEWGAAKAAANLQKHGVSFEEAKTVFWDDHALFVEDPDHSTTEDRFLLLGLSSTPRFLVVVHCYRRDVDTIRLISARRATRGERRRYTERWLR
jgi:hypothetical protein